VRPLILSVGGAGAVNAVFAALLGWLVIETQGGSALGLAERLFLLVEDSWPFIVALAIRRTHGPGAVLAAVLPPDPGSSLDGRQACRLPYGK